jgi:hypothetical protein
MHRKANHFYERPRRPRFLFAFSRMLESSLPSLLPPPSTASSLPSLLQHPFHPPTHTHINHVRTRKRFVRSPSFLVLSLSLSPARPTFVLLTCYPSLSSSPGGKGLGKGGAKRHRKILRDNMFVPPSSVPRALPSSHT